MSHQIKDNPPTCPNEDCNKVLDCYTGIGHDTYPSAKDITVCIGCGWSLVFDDDLQLDVLQISDYMKLDAEQKNEIDMAQKFVYTRLEIEKLH